MSRVSRRASLAAPLVLALLAGCGKHERLASVSQDAGVGTRIQHSRPGESDTVDARVATHETPRVVPDRHVSARAAQQARPRVYALTKTVWIRPEPRSDASWIGFLWFGSSVPLAEPEPRAGPGCRGAWHAIEPRGFVCVDGARATLDPEHPLVRGLAPLAPDLTSPWPHRYAESLDLTRLAALASQPLAAPALRDGQSHFKRRSTVAWTREATENGRAYLLADDLWWVPRERVRDYPHVTFRGVHLGRDAVLPLAFFRAHDRPRFVRGPGGELGPSEPAFERLSWVELSGRSETHDGVRYLETKQIGVFVREHDAVLPELAEHTPWGTSLSDTSNASVAAGRRTWIEVSILGGWLIAYEAGRPVFTTLVSPGLGGPAQPGRGLLAPSATPTGTFKINGKFATATMVSRSGQINAAVPWAHNFSGPYALHAAYWHDAWGEPQSGGCINVSPLDGRWLFYEFSQPRMPEHWHGLRWQPELEPSTTLVVKP
ncbi:MAG: L,D-transpeptidase [Polyangiaceae bacterium]